MNGVEHSSGTLPTTEQRVAAAFVAAAAGDALGWPMEARAGRLKDLQPRGHTFTFVSWERRAGGQWWGHRDPVLAGEYSDDTQLLLATARALLAGPEWVEHLRRRELPAWLLYERGGGGATKRAASAWAAGHAPWQAQRDKEISKYFEAGGNGVAMRIFPHVVGSSPDFRGQAATVLSDGISTHGHPRALVGALVYAYAFRAALRSRTPFRLGELIERLLNSREWGVFPSEAFPREWIDAAGRFANTDYEHAWQNTVEETARLLDIALEGVLKAGALPIDADVLARLGALKPETNGAGTVTAVSAIYLASRYAADPLTGVLEAVYARGADTDTLASMTASLLAAMVGEGAIRTEWKSVQDHDVLARAGADLVAGKPAVLRGSSRPWTAKDSDELLGTLASNTSSGTGPGPFGRYEVVRRESLVSMAKGAQVTRWKLRIESGQTVYVKKIQRGRHTVDEEGRGSSDARTGPPYTQPLPLREPEDPRPAGLIALGRAVGSSSGSSDFGIAVLVLSEALWHVLDRSGLTAVRQRLASAIWARECLERDTRTRALGITAETARDLVEIAWRVVRP